jgi:hypothetical protein
MALDSGEAVQYRWDAAGRLAETTDPEGETACGSPIYPPSALR